MNKKIVISSASAITPFGNTIDEIFENLIVNKKTSENKINLISDFNFYNRGYKAKTRIDKCAQICIHTTAEVLKDNQISSEKLGLITNSKFGCAISKESYFQQLLSLPDKQFASPKDFVQSIDNIPNSLASIECGIKGFTNHFVGDSYASIVALWQAAKCINDELTQKMAVTAFDCIPNSQMKLQNQNKDKNLFFSEASASICIEPKNTAKNILFEILGFGFGNSLTLDEASKSAIDNAVKRSEIKTQDISFYVEESVKKYTGECFSVYPILCLSLLSKMSDRIFENVYFKKGSIILITAHNNTSNAAAVCLKIPN